MSVNPHTELHDTLLVHPMIRPSVGTIVTFQIVAMIFKCNDDLYPMGL
jgi:hypothetical protein